MPTPPPVLDLRWFEIKLYPVILTSSAVQSVSHVSEIPMTENDFLRLPSIKFNWSRFFTKLRAFKCITEKFIKYFEVPLPILLAASPLACQNFISRTLTYRQLRRLVTKLS